MSAETERFQAIRARWQAATPGPWARCSANDGDCACGLVWDAEGLAAVAAVQEHNELGEGFNHDQYRANWDAVTAAPTDVATLLAALDAAEARVTALQTALAQTTHGYLHRVGEGTGYTVWHCRLCGDTTFDTHAPNHQPWCPVQVLADSYREE